MVISSFPYREDITYTNAALRDVAEYPDLLCSRIPGFGAFAHTWIYDVRVVPEGGREGSELMASSLKVFLPFFDLLSMALRRANERRPPPSARMVDDECISDMERSLEKLERAVRATKVRYHWVDNTTPPNNTRTEAKKPAVLISSDHDYLDNRSAQTLTDEDEDNEDVFSPSPTRPRAFRRLLKQLPGCLQSGEINDADTSAMQPEQDIGPDIKSSLPPPEAAHQQKMKLYQNVMEAVIPLLGLDTGESNDEELRMLKPLVSILTKESVRLDEIKKARERERVLAERKARRGGYRSTEAVVQQSST